jgi:WD40-like Beta Propeller Repeat
MICHLSIAKTAPSNESNELQSNSPTGSGSKCRSTNVSVRFPELTILLLAVLAASCDKQKTTSASANTDTRTETYRIDETKLGPVDSVMGSAVFSSDGNHFAYVAQRGRRECVVVDGQSNAEYDSIVDDSINFSRDGKHVAYAIKVGDKKRAVVDGQESTSYDGLGGLTFSPDSNHVAFGAWTGYSRFIVIDGQPGPSYDDVGLIHRGHPHLDGGKLTMAYEDIGGPTFSSDGKRVAYAAQKGRKQFTVIDGQAGSDYDVIGNLAFSRDGKHLAYSAKTGAAWVTVTDGKVSANYDQIGCGAIWSFTDFNIGEMFEIGTPIFSADGKHVAYAARTGKSWAIVLDGHAGESYDSIDSLTFSPDSTHVAFSAQSGNQSFVVVGGRSIANSDSIVSDTLVLSPDSQHFAFATGSIGKQCVIRDGNAEEGIKYDCIAQGSMIFSPDSTRLAYVAEKGSVTGAAKGDDLNVGNRNLAVAQNGSGVVNVQLSLGSSGADGNMLVAQGGEKLVAVIDHQPGAEYDEIGTLSFSSDSKHLAYVAKSGDKWCLVLDGQSRATYDRMPDTTPSFNSKGVLEFVALREQSLYRIECVPAQ